MKTNHIYVVSRAKFKENLSTMTEQQFMSGAFISIHEPLNHNKELFGGSSDTILSSVDNVLNLWFDDAEEDLPIIGSDEKLTLFNEEMAMAVKKFIERNKGAKYWLLHCTAGICRSGAVGEVLSDYFGIPYNMFKRDNPQIQPNVLVKRILNQTLKT